MMILSGGGGGGGGHSFSLLWFRGGCEKFPTKIKSSIGVGGNHFFLKKKRKSKYAVGQSYNIIRQAKLCVDVAHCFGAFMVDTIYSPAQG